MTPSRIATICDFAKYKISDGIDLYIRPTTKFKTTTIKLFIHQPLYEGTVTKGALLPSVLRRGCRRYVNMRKIVRFLEQLYGASLSVDVTKIGEVQVIYFKLEIVSDRYIPRKRGILADALKFLKYIIVHPIVEKGGLKPTYVQQEKVNLRRSIEGMINDRSSYTFERCVQEMCRNEKYALFEHGRLDDIDGISPVALHDYHQWLLRTAPMDIFVYGDVKQDKFANRIGELFGTIKRADVQPPPKTDANIPVSAERVTIEEREVEQGNLIMGCRTYTTWGDDDIYAMIFYSAILGGFPHSKLFTNVREKEGLCYHASSSLEETKGLMFISAGISSAKYERALEVIKQQMLDMVEGKISETELESTRVSLIDRFRAQEDSPASKINSLLEMLVNRRAVGAKEIEERLAAVTKEDVVRAASKVKLDTIYFLKEKGSAKLGT